MCANFLATGKQELLSEDTKYDEQDKLKEMPVLIRKDQVSCHE